MKEVSAVGRIGPQGDSGATPQSPTHAPTPLVRRRRRAVAAGIAAALAVSSAAAFWLDRDDAASAAAPPPSAVVERGAIEERVAAGGTIHPLRYVDVGTQVTGQVKALHVAVGDRVEAGALIAELDPALLQSKVDVSRAALRDLQSQEAERRARHLQAQQLHRRNERLRADDAVSVEALEQSASALEQSRAQIDGVRSQQQLVQAQLQGELTGLSYTRIRAPLAGTVVSLTARQGQTLVANQQAPVILRIADLGTMTVWAQVSEADLPRIRIGMTAQFNTLGQPDRRWSGKVRQILPTPEVVSNVVLYNVLFDVDNADGALQPQMSAQAGFVVGKAKDALLVPADALLPVEGAAAKRRNKGEADAGDDGNSTASDSAAGPSRHYLVRVLDGQTVSERLVTIGLNTRETAQVLSGLAEGERVLVSAAPPRGKAKKPKREADA